jgi:primosomal protein N' (replication factor Y)
MCHHCGLALGFPQSCPECDADNRFAACGPGVERLADEVTAHFPEARIEVVASDTFSGPRATRELIGRIEDGDLRAAERTFQLLYQVGGRAGRADRPGRVLLQTYLPDHPVMAALVSGDREAFLAREKEARQRAEMPPYGRLVALIISGRDDRVASAVARKFGAAAPRDKGVSVFGPAPAPLAVLRGLYRYRLLLKAGRQVPVQELVRAWLARVPSPSNVRVQVDIDPYSFL